MARSASGVEARLRQALGRLPGDREGTERSSDVEHLGLGRVTIGSIADEGGRGGGQETRAAGYQFWMGRTPQKLWLYSVFFYVLTRGPVAVSATFALVEGGGGQNDHT